MVKPVSESTAPAEPISTPEQIVESGPWGLYSEEYERFRTECIKADPMEWEAKMAKDAERYRWLRDTTTEPLPLNILIAGGDRLDAAIDAAMRG